MSNNSKWIEQALRSERPRRKVSPGFAERVIDALPPRRPGAASVSLPKERAIGPRLILAAGLAGLTLFGWLSFSPEPEVRSPVVVQQAPLQADPIAINVPNVTAEQFQALSTKIDQPLEQELDRVLADTRNAIQFVAANFMPEN